MSAKNVALCKALGWYVDDEIEAIYWALLNKNLPEPDIVDWYNSEEEAWSAVPDIEHDIAAGLAALDALPVEATPRLVRMVTARGQIEYEWMCGVIFIGVDRENIEQRGATPAEAVFAALCAYYRVEVSSD